MVEILEAKMIASRVSKKWDGSENKWWYYQTAAYISESDDLETVMLAACSEEEVKGKLTKLAKALNA